MRLEGKEAPSNSHSGPVSNGSGHSNQSTPHKAASGSSLANGSSTNGESNGLSAGKAVVKPTGSFYGHSREEVTRILIQSLTDLGYHGAAGVLSRESGYELENTSVAAFRNAIQEGSWAEAESLLFGRRSQGEVGGVDLSGNGYSEEQLEWLSHNGTAHPAPGLPLAEGANQKEMLFLIRQQRYLELLEQRDITAALMVLRNELQPLHQDRDRLHALSNLMMCNTADKLRRDARWDGAEGESRNQLLSELSTSIAPEVMIPEHRLAVLLDQVQDNQINNCLYHNTDKNPSLYHDHICDREDFPTELIEELRDHTNEVWYVAFSNTGSMLATASKDNSIYIYSTSTWKALMRLSASNINDMHHSEAAGVGYVAWSPDDQYLLACSQANDLTIYDISRNGEKFMALEHFTYPVTSAAWMPDGRSFVVTSHDDKHPLEMYRLGESSPYYSFKNPAQQLRVTDCAITSDGTKLLVVTTQKCVLTYDLQSPTKNIISEFVMEDKIHGITLSKDGKTILISLNNNQLFMLEATTGTLLQAYTGIKAENFVIRSSYGGAGEGFVISGSEDSQVYIWKRQSGVQVACLEAHAPGPTNHVAWHPTNPGIFASAGDDRRVKIWGSATEAAKRQASKSRRSSQLREMLDEQSSSLRR